MNDKRIPIGLKVPRKVYEGFREVIFRKEGMLKGLLSKRLEEAIILKTRLEKGEIEIVESIGYNPARKDSKQNYTLERIIGYLEEIKERIEKGEDKERDFVNSAILPTLNETMTDLDIYINHLKKERG